MIGLAKVKKEFYEGSFGPVAGWGGDTAYGRAEMAIHGTCQLLGYEDKVLPAEPAKPERTIKKAIYNCI